jgi:hypothetical protein
MRFTLNYRGPLRTNGAAREKMNLRRGFHPQLRNCSFPPLDGAAVPAVQSPLPARGR